MDPTTDSPLLPILACPSPGRIADQVGPAGHAVAGPAKAHRHSRLEIPVLCEFPPACRFINQSTTVQKSLSVAERQLISNGHIQYLRYVIRSQSCVTAAVIGVLGCSAAA